MLTYAIAGYVSGDVDLSGGARFAGAGNDTNVLRDNVINHPANILNLLTYTITAQLP